MKRIKLSFLFLVLIVPVIAQGGKRIVILHTNDLHSRLNGFSPECQYSPLTEDDDDTRGGFSRISTILRNEAGKDNQTTLILDAGDFLMGTLFHSLEQRTGFQLQLMKKMGYDVVSIGNHEFDFGPQTLAEIIIQSEKSGEIPEILLGNVVFNEKDPEDDILEDLYNSGVISKKLVVDKDGLRIGFFSLLGKDAADVAPLSKPVKFSKQISSARAIVRELKGDNCDIIICISHSGLTMDKAGRWTGEDVRLAESVRGIDVIISGHSHTRLIDPLVINGIPIVQTGAYGENVGRLVLNWSDGFVRIDNYSLIPVDDKIRGDEEIQKMIEDQENLVSGEILAPLHIKYSDPVAETDFILECNEQGDFINSNLGPLIADAIHNYVNNHSKDGCDISMVAVGVIRDKIIPGILTAPDVFRIMSLGSGEDEVPGYPLARLYVTGRELKNILEILQVAYKSSPSNFCFYSGMKVEFNPDKGLLRKIGKIEITDHEGIHEVGFSKRDKKLYSVTANSYMLEFIGIIRKASFGLINVVPKDSNGNPLTDMKKAVIDMDEGVSGVQEGKEWLALIEFLGSMEDLDNNGIPDIDRKYAFPVHTFYSVGKQK